MAEGVETAAQLAFLEAHGCDEVQGLLFCPPLPAAEFLEAVQAHAFAHPADGEVTAPCRSAQPEASMPRPRATCSRTSRTSRSH